jgi:hypothetical protein
VPSSTFALILALFFGCPALSLAQSTSAAPRSPSLQQQRYDELVTWLAEYKRWEAWTLKWGNRVAFNHAGGLVKNRPQRPEPPSWLADDCRAYLSTDGKLGEACAILAHWDALPELLLTRRTLGGQFQTDVAPKSSFLQRLHVSGGWVPAQFPAPSVYLVAGMQVGIVEVGRATLPAVGVGLVAMADGRGGTEWKPATLLGIGYRLASFGFPWVNREANLHVNVARAQIHGVTTVPVGLDPSQNLMGFSLTFAKR